MTGMAARRGVRLEPARRLPAVEHRQAHVHQDQIRAARARAMATPCSPSTAISDLVAPALQPARQHVAVHLVVFDSRIFGMPLLLPDLLADRLGRRGARTVVAPDQSCSDVIDAARGAGSVPFCSTCDHAAPFSRCDLLAGQVLGGHDDHRDRRASRLSRRIRSSNSKPSISGIIRSSRMSAGLRCARARRAPAAVRGLAHRASPPSAACAAASSPRSSHRRRRPAPAPGRRRRQMPVERPDQHGRGRTGLVM